MNSSVELCVLRYSNNFSKSKDKNLPKKFLKPIFNFSKSYNLNKLVNNLNKFKKSHLIKSFL